MVHELQIDSGNEDESASLQALQPSDLREVLLKLFAPSFLPKVSPYQRGSMGL